MKATPRTTTLTYCSLETTLDLEHHFQSSKILYQHLTYDQHVSLTLCSTHSFINSTRTHKDSLKMFTSAMHRWRLIPLPTLSIRSLERSS